MVRDGHDLAGRVNYAADSDEGVTIARKKLELAKMHGVFQVWSYLSILAILVTT